MGSLSSSLLSSLLSSSLGFIFRIINKWRAAGQQLNSFLEFAFRLHERFPCVTFWEAHVGHSSDD
jgi:hypothetical protein